MKKMYLFVLSTFLFATLETKAAFAQSSSTVTTSNPSSSIFSKEKWGASYSNYMNGPTFSESNGGSINHYLTLKHKFKSGWNASGVFRPDSNFGNNQDSFSMGDPYLRVDYPALYESGSFSIKGNFRYYAPVSQSSQKAKTNGAISPLFQIGGKVGRLELTYILVPKLILNSVTEDKQKLASQGHWLAVAYKLSDLVNLDFAVYPTWTYARNEPVAFNDLPAYPGFTLNFSETLSLSPYVEVPLYKIDAKGTSVGGTLSYAFL